MNSINPKVTSGATTAVFGGGACAYMTVWLLQHVGGYPTEWFTTDFVINLTAIYCGLGSFAGGWLKKHDAL